MSVRYLVGAQIFGTLFSVLLIALFWPVSTSWMILVFAIVLLVTNFVVLVMRWVLAGADLDDKRLERAKAGIEIAYQTLASLAIIVAGAWALSIYVLQRDGIWNLNMTVT